MRVDFSSDYFGATLDAPKARSAKLGSRARAWPIVTQPFSKGTGRAERVLVHPDFKIPGKAPPLLFDFGEQRSAWRAGSPRDSEKPLDSFGTVGREGCMSSEHFGQLALAI